MSQDAARQAQERAKQNEQPDSPIKTCPLPEVIQSYYQKQGEVKSPEERDGEEQIHTWFHRAGPSFPLRAYFVAPQPEQR
jgi:predicted Zn-dependent protease